MADAQMRTTFDFAGARGNPPHQRGPRSRRLRPHLRELWVVRNIDKDGFGPLIMCELPGPEPERLHPLNCASRTRHGADRVPPPVPALIVRFPDGSREFRYPRDRAPDGRRDLARQRSLPRDLGHRERRWRSGHGDRKTNPQGIGDLLGSEEGAPHTRCGRLDRQKERRAAVRRRALERVLSPSCISPACGFPTRTCGALAKLVDEVTRSFLEKSLALETGVVALAIEDRDRIGRCPD